MKGFFCERDRIRTCDRLLRRQMLYPAELRVPISIANIVFLVFKSIPDFEFYFTLFHRSFLGYNTQNIYFLNFVVNMARNVSIPIK